MVAESFLKNPHIIVHYFSLSRKYYIQLIYSWGGRKGIIKLYTKNKDMQAGISR